MNLLLQSYFLLLVVLAQIQGIIMFLTFPHDLLRLLLLNGILENTLLFESWGVFPWCFWGTSHLRMHLRLLLRSQLYIASKRIQITRQLIGWLCIGVSFLLIFLCLLVFTVRFFIDFLLNLSRFIWVQTRIELVVSFVHIWLIPTVPRRTVLVILVHLIFDSMVDQLCEIVHLAEQTTLVLGHIIRHLHLLFLSHALFPLFPRLGS